MADPVDSIGGPDDDVLTAYLDGELEGGARARVDQRLAAEPELRARLLVLRAGVRPFAPAYDALLDMAPGERMQAMLAGVIARSSAAAVKRPAPISRRLMAIAAALVIFAVGGAIGYAVSTNLNQPERPGWRQVVAEYFVLVTPETLAVIQEDPATMTAELGTIGAKLSLDLGGGKLALSEAELKRAQLFEFRGMPLVQLAYLLDDDQPMALCIINNGRPDADIAFEEREGSNIVFWTKDGRGYMLISKGPREALEAYAGDLAARFS